MNSQHGQGWVRPFRRAFMLGVVLGLYFAVPWALFTLTAAALEALAA